jgi:hypothetical protein
MTIGFDRTKLKALLQQEIEFVIKEFGLPWMVK